MLSKYLPVGKGLNDLANDEPLNTVTDEAFDGADEENDPSGEAVGGEAGEKAKGFTNVFGDGEVVELHLCKVHEGFESVGVVGERVVVAGDGLNPHGGD